MKKSLQSLGEDVKEISETLAMGLKIYIPCIIVITFLGMQSRTVILKMSLSEQQQQHLLGTCWKCKFSGHTPDLLNKEFWGWSPAMCFNKPARWFWCTLTFENHCNRAIFFQFFWLRSTRRSAYYILAHTHTPPHTTHTGTLTNQKLQETVIILIPWNTVWYFLFYSISFH